jgi:H/ACA ribonucleoprotein complex non-core subunit NAF1
MEERSNDPTSQATGEQPATLELALAIPGLGMIESDTSTEEVSQWTADDPTSTGLLDALMQHVDSQSNAHSVHLQGSTHTEPQNTVFNVENDEPAAKQQEMPSDWEGGQSDSDTGLADGVKKDKDEPDSAGMPAMESVGPTRDLRLDTAVQQGTSLQEQEKSDTTSMSRRQADHSTDKDVVQVDIDALGIMQNGDVAAVVPQSEHQDIEPTTATSPGDMQDASVAGEAARPEDNAPTVSQEDILPVTSVKQETSRAQPRDGDASAMDVGNGGDEMSNAHSRQKDYTLKPNEMSISERAKEEPQASFTSQQDSKLVTSQNGFEQAVEYKTNQDGTKRKLEQTRESHMKSLIPQIDAAHPNVDSLRDQLPSVNHDEEAGNLQNGEGIEWEIDSSPIESSSDSDSSSDTTSTDDSDEDDEDADGDYAMLNSEQQARILMAGDGGSDDEGIGKGGAKGEAAQLRTANEKPEEVIPKPDINVTEDMKIEELGNVEAVVENTVLVKAKVSGEYRVLGSNSLLCLKDRNVVGVVSETLGRVQQPLYTVRFTNEEAIKEAGLAEKNTTVYYVEQHSTFVFTQPLRAVKGSDASNFHDEEVAADEMEFSDDEAEAEHKRQMKSRKQDRRDDRNERVGYSRGRRGGTNTNGYTRTYRSVNGDTNMEMNYDDVPPMGEDGYTPLARPNNLHEMMGSGEAPVEGRQPIPSFPDRAPDRGHDRGRGRSRGRGDRANRGGRGRGRGGWDRSNNNHNQDRRASFSSGQKSSPAPLSGPGSSPTTSSFGLPPKPQNLSLPPIPPPSQYSMSQMQSQPQTQQPSFSYQHPPPPQAPTISPQPPSYPTFSPSPISPLPQSHFNFNTYANQQNQQPSPSQQYNGYLPQQPQQPQQQSYSAGNQQSYLGNNQWHNPFSTGQQQMPPPGSHINPAFFDPLRRQGQGGRGGQGQGGWR